MSDTPFCCCSEDELCDECRVHNDAERWEWLCWRHQREADIDLEMTWDEWCKSDGPMELEKQLIEEGFDPRPVLNCRRRSRAPK